METVTNPPKYAVCLSNEITPPTMSTDDAMLHMKIRCHR